MPKQIRLRRGTTAQHANFTGALGELTVDTNKKTVVVHDGATAGGFPLALEATQIIRTGNLVWVDAVNGNDSNGQRGRLQFPYLTLGAAKNAAQAGDTINVLPGSYNEKNLAKNGVNWHFWNGAIISYAGGAGGGIFDTGWAGGACSFDVTGYGVFRVTSEPGPQAVIKSAYSGDNIKIECDKIEGIGSALDASGKVLIRCNEMKSTSAACVANFTTGNVTIYAHRISSSGGHGVEISGGTLEVVARYIASSAGKGIRFNAGTLMVTAYEISSTTDSALEYTAYYSSLCRISNARLVSLAGAGLGRAVFISSGTGNLRFHNCSFVSTSPAAASIDSATYSTVHLYGECVANMAKGAVVTLNGSALTVNSNLT